jgi:hypothetical protein
MDVYNKPPVADYRMSYPPLLPCLIQMHTSLSRQRILQIAIETSLEFISYV